jgi:hypothetical protein
METNQRSCMLVQGYIICSLLEELWSKPPWWSLSCVRLGVVMGTSKPRLPLSMAMVLRATAETRGRGRERDEERLFVTEVEYK